MRFKDWLNEDEMTGAAAYGNTPDPFDNGLHRPQRLSKPVPDSGIANKTFLGKKFAKKHFNKK